MASYPLDLEGRLWESSSEAVAATDWTYFWRISARGAPQAFDAFWSLIFLRSAGLRLLLRRVRLEGPLGGGAAEPSVASSEVEVPLDVRGRLASRLVCVAGLSRNSEAWGRSGAREDDFEEEEVRLLLCGGAVVDLGIWRVLAGDRAVGGACGALGAGASGGVWKAVSGELTAGGSGGRGVDGMNMSGGLACSSSTALLRSGARAK